MGKRDRKCYLCGESYKYCPTCSQDRTKPAFMSEFHSESCKNIFDICTRFNIGMISKIEAQEELKSCDLTNKENFASYVQRDLDNIMAEEPIVVTLDAEIKEICEDKAIVETSLRGNKFKKHTHEVVIKKEENE
jgi:hypothetical protein